MIEAAIRAKLVADADVNGIISGRIHPFTVPTEIARPKLTYQRIDTVRWYSNDGPTGSPRIRLQVDCWADELLTAKTLADKVRQCLDGYRGVTSGVQVDGVHLQDERDMPQAMAPGQEKPIQRVSLDFIVDFQE